MTSFHDEVLIWYADNHFASRIISLVTTVIMNGRYAVVKDLFLRQRTGLGVFRLHLDVSDGQLAICCYFQGMLLFRFNRLTKLLINLRL